MNRPLRTIFMGTPEFSVPTLDMLAQKTKLQVVVTQPDRRQGRGKTVQFSPVKVRALALGLEVIGPDVVKGRRFAARMAEYRPDVIITAAFGRLLGPRLLDVPRFGCLNVHASILPRYRGAAPVNWAIINGEAETGVSIMRTVSALDAGDVYTVSRLRIENHTAGELTQQLAVLGADALWETLSHIEHLSPVAQNDADATFAPVLKKEDGHLNWNHSAVQLERQIRGMHPWPGTFSIWEGESLKIHQATVLDDAEITELPVGTIVSHTSRGVDVACGAGILRLISLQMPGRKRLDAAPFYAGHKFAQGDRFF